MVVTLIRCINGPRLYSIYKINDREGKTYDPNSLEVYADNIIRVFNFFWCLSFYVSPAIAFVLYKKGFNSLEGATLLARYIGSLSVLLIGTLCVRGLGRYSNSDYLTFLNVLNSSQRNNQLINKQNLSKYDFDFSAWPVEFRWDDPSADKNRIRKDVPSSSLHRRTSLLEKIRGLPCDILSFAVIHSFGRRLIYPGAVSLLQYIATPVLRQGRAKLVEKYKGQRFKLLTRDGNQIDSMFVDRRQNEKYANGNILVVCCEGNAGFYEYGIMTTPLQAGYSVLGWNHPGFGGSTGVPFPEQETNAIDVVMQMALHKLGFQPHQILLYAWSIGGYTATWAAMNYPDIHGLVLDATFDDILPLAQSRMPPVLKPLVVRTIRKYMDLNNVENLKRYPGPVIFIRRTRDEMISTRPSDELQTNRGNYLLMKFLQYRYPKLVGEDTTWILRDWLYHDQDHQMLMWNERGVNATVCELYLTSYLSENPASFPMHIGEDMDGDTKIKLVLYLASKYMVDFNSTHCSPLPPERFVLPWRFPPTLPTMEEDY